MDQIHFDTGNHQYSWQVHGEFSKTMLYKKQKIFYLFQIINNLYVKF